jgi:DNA-binding transcriptional MerR regulator
MRIGELADQAGTSARMIRYYESQGLLRVRRSPNGYRDYDAVDLKVVREIRSLQEIGFTLEETRPFVDCLQAGNDSGMVCAASVDAYRRKLEDLDGCIARLTALRSRLRHELAVVEPGDRGGIDGERGPR